MLKCRSSEADIKKFQLRPKMSMLRLGTVRSGPNDDAADIDYPGEGILQKR